MSSQPNPVETYGAYRVLRPLGEGASGCVYLAERTDFTQRVALKVFRPDFLAAGVTNLAEPKLLASLDHRHIVRVLQQGATPEGTRYLAMEYIQGEDIVSFCNSRSLSTPARVRLLLQVMEAVEYAHRHLVLHGDLKPENVLVAEGNENEDEVKLVDFGSAVLIADAAATSHTPAFASPEQRTGGRITVASDIYSLGLLTRVLLQGVRDADLFAILQKALQPAPEDRYATAEAMANDLRAYAEGRTPAVRSAPFAERLRKWTRRHKVGAAMTAVLLFALLFSAIGVTLKASQARRSRRETEARLRELVRLTGTLQSELYGSVRALPNASASEKLLTESAAATLDELAASGPTDPTLRSELANQYTQLAKLELEQAHDRKDLASSSLKEQAVEHIKRSLALWPAVDPGGDARAQLLRTISTHTH